MTVGDDTKNSETRSAIEKSFLDLLESRPFDKISIRDIAERSNISRNTFYYYFQDIYDLVESIFREEAERIASGVENYETWQTAFLGATEFARSHRRAVFHIYNSNNRGLLERYFHNAVLSAMTAHVRKEAVGLSVSEQNILALSRFYAAALLGLSADWFNNSMKGDPYAFLNDLGPLLYGNIRASLEHVSQSDS